MLIVNSLFFYFCSLICHMYSIGKHDTSITMNNQNVIRPSRLSRNSNWLKTRFLKNKLLHKRSRDSIAISINYLLERDHRKLSQQNYDIHRSTKETNQHLEVLTDKLHTLHDICLFLRIPLEVYFEERMIRLRHSAEQYMAAMEEEIRAEVEHWQQIHTVLSQPLLEPGLLRSYYGGLPRQIQQSPSSEIDTICEESEILESTKKSNRSLAPINTFSILSNAMNHSYLSTNKLNKTFIERQSSTNNSLNGDENLTSAKSLRTFAIYSDDSDWATNGIDDSIICID